MTDWAKLKVTELKEQCQSRSISLTGLKLKQQYIDKLVEYESSQPADNTAADSAPADETVEEPVAEKTNGTGEDSEKDVAPTEQPESQQEELLAPAEQSKETETENQAPPSTEAKPEGTLAIPDDAAPDGQPVTIDTENKPSETPEIRPDTKDDTPLPDTVTEVQINNDNDVRMSDTEPVKLNGNSLQPVPSRENSDQASATNDVHAEDTLKYAQEPERTEILNKIEPDAESALSTPSEDTRKRKRRSVTPPPDAEEIAKKAKGIHGGAVVTKTVSRPPTPQPSPPTTEAQHSVSVADVDSSKLASQEDKDTASEVVQEKSETKPRPRSRSPSLKEDLSVPPALHAATRSLYMRNFKRPLNIQTLKSHIVTLARGSSSVAQDEDPIKLYYVNNIRSHAFVTFSSIAAASRVRAAMHGTPFPDEPHREALWIDFMPEDKIEGWKDQEMNGSRASGRNASSKLEVVYIDTGNGYVAEFREAGASQFQRPSIGMASTNRSSISQAGRQTPFSTDPTRTASIASGVHPDRANFVPRSPNDRRRSSPPAQRDFPTPRKAQHEDKGIGFKGLDDLFESTVAKPKLYYKLPPQPIIDDRTDMLKDLYSDRGATGDPGMKRYTFEQDHRGREDWVDNGPEFGYGKRGQDRLVGIGANRGRGGFRGGRGRGGFFGGDSYRGGGRR